MKRKTAPEIIAEYLCWDWGDVKACAYQPGRTATPVYACGGDWYFCCPTAKQKLPAGWKWEPVHTSDKRTIYRAGAEEG